MCALTSYYFIIFDSFVGEAQGGTHNTAERRTAHVSIKPSLSFHHPLLLLLPTNDRDCNNRSRGKDVLRITSS